MGIDLISATTPREEGESHQNVVVQGLKSLHRPVADRRQLGAPDQADQFRTVHPYDLRVGLIRHSVDRTGRTMRRDGIITVERWVCRPARVLARRRTGAEVLF